ncbi:MAG: hypothetical protein IKB44_00220, partial [Clostridia bacterium]|nr:hypothetical protein [Clostridia bacterium]
VSERKIEVDSIKEAFSLLIKIPEICSITKETIYYNHVNTFLTSNGKIEECESLSEKDITDAIDFENIKEEELVLKTGEGSIFDYHNGVLKG